MKKWLCGLLMLLATATVMGQAKDPNALYAIIDTEKGKIEVLLRPEIAPVTVSNFVNLATRGFYDGLTFHRVEPGFMAQGGDPEGNGSGGPGYEFEDEIVLRHNQDGILSMANAGPGTNGSQFFLTHQATPHLNGLHTVFGLTQTGKEIIRTIRIGDTINSITIEGNVKPLLEQNRARVEEWNRVLDQNFPKLRPSLLSSP